MGPQTIQITPEIVVSGRSLRLQGLVSITVYDERTIPQIGMRDGIYQKSRFIYLDEYFTHSIKTAVEGFLRTRGMEPVSSSSVTQMQIYIDQLSYYVPEGTYVSSVNLKAAIRVEILKGGSRYAGRYLSDDSYRVMNAPSNSQNAEMTNAVLNKVLVRAMEDTELLSFLDGTTGS